MDGKLPLDLNQLEVDSFTTDPMEPADGDPFAVGGSIFVMVTDPTRLRVCQPRTSAEPA